MKWVGAISSPSPLAQLPLPDADILFPSRGFPVALPTCREQLDEHVRASPVRLEPVQGGIEHMRTARVEHYWELEAPRNPDKGGTLKWSARRCASWWWHRQGLSSSA